MRIAVGSLNNNSLYIISFLFFELKKKRKRHARFVMAVVGPPTIEFTFLYVYNTESEREKKLLHHSPND
jgi:hypothetical protein